MKNLLVVIALLITINVSAQIETNVIDLQGKSTIKVVPDLIMGNLN